MATVGLLCLALLLVCCSIARGQEKVPPTPTAAKAPAPMDKALAKDWLVRWDKGITGSIRNRYCNRETGEQLGWLVSPFLDGFHYGHMATGDRKWIDLLIDWSDAVIKRGVTEPDGYVG